MLLSVSFAIILIIITNFISILLTMVHEITSKLFMNFAVRCEIKINKNRQPTHAVLAVKLFTHKQYLFNSNIFYLSLLL